MAADRVLDDWAQLAVLAEIAGNQEAGAAAERIWDEISRLRARVAELDAAGEVRTEWSVRSKSGNVWQLTPATESFTRSIRQEQDPTGTLVIREVRTIAGPWVDAPAAPSAPSGEES